MSLTTPGKIQVLQIKLYQKAKNVPVRGLPHSK